jgi:DNA ligase (NAD+)
VLEEGQARAEPFAMPGVCPSCATPVERPEGEAMLYCPNSACPARIYWGLAHFVSRGAMDIRGLGERTIATLLERGMVQDVGDIYTLTAEQLLTLEGFKEKSAQNLLDGIATSKQQGLARVLFGLGVRHVGEIAAQTLARHFGSMERLMAASIEEIEAVHTIGHTMAAALHAWMAEPRNQEVVAKLAAAGVKMTEERSEPAQGPLTGKTFVITGTHPTMTRPQIEAFIQDHGGRVTGSVTKKTDYLVVGEDAGSKLARARELGVKELSEAALLALPDELGASSAEPAESTETPAVEPLQTELL